MSDKSEALRLADELDAMFGATEIDERVTEELRRLHEVNQELLEALRECELFVRTLGLDSEPAARAASFARSAIAKATGVDHDAQP